MNYISERLLSLNEVTVSQGERIKWKNANMRERERERTEGYFHFMFHHLPQLYLLISLVQSAWPVGDKPPPNTTLLSHHSVSHCKSNFKTTMQ